MKATEQYFPAVLFMKLCKVVLTVKLSLECNNLNEIVLVLFRFVCLLAVVDFFSKNKHGILFSGLSFVT